MRRILPKAPARTWNHSEKLKIARDMLERYSGSSANKICRRVIITNFDYYLEQFSKMNDEPIISGSAMKCVNAPKIDVSILTFNIGSPMAALTIEMLSVIEPVAVLMLGMCGGLHRDLKIGDFFLPMAAIRDEGTSHHFFPEQVPALPTFAIQKFISRVIEQKGLDYQAGVVHTTDYRFWEFDSKFKNILALEKVGAVEMECASLFITAFACKVPCGALLLVSDLPLTKPKTKSSANQVFKNYTNIHLELGIKAMKEIDEERDKIRHFAW